MRLSIRTQTRKQDHVFFTSKSSPCPSCPSLVQQPWTARVIPAAQSKDPLGWWRASYQSHWLHHKVCSVRSEAGSLCIWCSWQNPLAPPDSWWLPIAPRTPGVFGEKNHVSSQEEKWEAQQQVMSRSELPLQSSQNVDCHALKPTSNAHHMCPLTKGAFLQWAAFLTRSHWRITLPKKCTQEISPKSARPSEKSSKLCRPWTCSSASRDYWWLWTYHAFNCSGAKEEDSTSKTTQIELTIVFTLCLLGQETCLLYAFFTCNHVVTLSWCAFCNVHFDIYIYHWKLRIVSRPPLKSFTSKMWCKFVKVVQRCWKPGHWVWEQWHHW